MKYVIILLALTQQLIVNSQNSYNNIDEISYNNISFDGITLSTLKYFQANESNLSELFNVNFLNTCNDTSGEALYYESSKLNLGYFGFESNKQLSSINVVSSQLTVNIGSVDLNIGSYITPLESLFNNFLTVNDEGALTSLAYISSEDDDSTIEIRFIESTGIIQTIKFLSFN